MAKRGIYREAPSNTSPWARGKLKPQKVLLKMVFTVVKRLD